MGSFSTSDGNYKILMLVLQGSIAVLLMETKMAVGTEHVGCVSGNGGWRGRKGGLREKGQSGSLS